MLLQRTACIIIRCVANRETAGRGLVQIPESYDPIGAGRNQAALTFTEKRAGRDSRQFRLVVARLHRLRIGANLGDHLASLNIPPVHLVQALTRGGQIQRVGNFRML